MLILIWRRFLTFDFAFVFSALLRFALYFRSFLRRVLGFLNGLNGRADFV
jgi:hypothetical protein